MFAKILLKELILLQLLEIVRFQNVSGYLANSTTNFLEIDFLPWTSKLLKSTINFEFFLEHFRKCKSSFEAISQEKLKLH